MQQGFDAIHAALHAHKLESGELHCHVKRLFLAATQLHLAGLICVRELQRHLQWQHHFGMVHVTYRATCSEAYACSQHNANLN